MQVTRQERNNSIYIWNKIQNSTLEKFKKVIEDKYDLRFGSYWELHQWTVKNFSTFWEEIWHHIGIITSEPYHQVFAKNGKGFLDNDWFCGAKLNYAENILRKRDNEFALICLDERGNEESITFAEMFEKVKLYAAALRKNGLKKGDRVACFLPNIKEAIFAMLATTSIGAIWGGALPYYGARVASNAITRMEPKFLITADNHQDNGVLYKMIDHLPFIVSNAPTIQKVIVVATEKETYNKDLSYIHNCVLLEEFLQGGRNPDDSVPDITFEQLPFNHPVSMSSTSGTSGFPKAPIHSAGALITLLSDFALYYNMKPGDVICSCYPMGWNLWEYLVPTLALGVKLFVYCGSPYYKVNGMNFLDLLAKYKVKFVYLVASIVDKFEKMHFVPKSSSNFDNLKFIMLGGSPVKKENYEYLYNTITKDAFIGSLYGTTEVFSALSGFDTNMPVFSGEIQVPALGMDIQSFDENGKSVVGQRGELVICAPAPNFPLYLWKDNNFELITKLYLSKYPGVWSQKDECWINPKTNGIVIIGRSDDTFKQYGERFGSSDIYNAIHSLEELQDYICVSQQKSNGDSRVILFVKMQTGFKFTPEIREKIAKTITDELWEDCVPEVILEIPDIPYNLNNKRMENVIREIVKNNKIPDVINIKNPETLKHYLDIEEIIIFSHNREISTL